MDHETNTGWSKGDQTGYPVSTGTTPELPALTLENPLIAALVDYATGSQPNAAEEALVGIEDLAARHGVDVDGVLDALDQPDLMSQVRLYARVLRQRGDLLRIQIMPLIETLIGDAHRMAKEDMISPAVLPRMLDTLYKLTGLAEERAARVRAEITPQPPTISVNILQGDMPAPPPAKDGELNLTIIAPDWTGGSQRVIAEQDGWDQ